MISWTWSVTIFLLASLVVLASTSDDKRAWSDLTPGWGKRDQLPVEGVWGKRGSPLMPNTVWGKREGDWNAFRGSWGKRDWNKLHGSWGKRDSSDWNRLQGLWGKRAAWGHSTDEDESSLK